MSEGSSVNGGWTPKESVFEDWLAEDPSRLCGRGARLLGRQLGTGEGRLDLLIYERPTRLTPGGAVVVVEIKRDKIDLQAIGQVARYMNDVGSIFPDLPYIIPAPLEVDEYPKLHGALVAPEITGLAAEVVNATSELRFIAMRPTLRFQLSDGATNEHELGERKYLVDVEGRVRVGEEIAEAVMTDRAKT